MSTDNLSRLSRYKKKAAPEQRGPIRRVVGYARVSTDSQEDNTSFATQRESITNYCLAKNYQLLTIFADVASGASFDRDQFKLMQSYIKNEQVEAVILYKLDRLSRSVVDGYSFIQKLERENISLVSINENIDNSTPTGQAMLQLIFTFAEMERKVITERMVNGRRMKLKNGDKPAGMVFGYAYTEDKTVAKVPGEAYLIQRVFEWYLEHPSLSSVRRKTLDAGYTTRRGKAFSRQALHYILTNAFYTGELIANGRLVAGNHDPIISKEQFLEVQKQLQLHRWTQSAP